MRGASKTEQTQATRPDGRQRHFFRRPAVLVMIFATGLAATFYGYRQWRITAPPTVPTDGVDVAIVEAIQQARQVVRNSPRSADAWGTLGMTLFAHDFEDAAADCFSEAERFDSQDPRWVYLRARCVNQNQPELAKTLLQRCVELGGDHADLPHLYLVELLLEEQQLDTAETFLQELLEQNPNDIRARHAKARLYFLREDYQACKDEIMDLQNGIRRRYEAAKQRVQSLVQQGDRKGATTEAQAANKKLMEGLRKQKTLGLMLANALRQLGELENSEKQRQLAMKQTDSQWPDPYAQQVVSLRTGLKTMLSNADFAYGQNRYDESMAILKSAIAKYPDSPFAYILLGRAYIRLGRVAQVKDQDKEKARELYHEAEEQLRQALSIDQNSVEAKFRIGVSDMYMAELESDRQLLAKAESWFRQAISTKPDFTMAYFNLARCLVGQGQGDAAIEALRSTIRCEPDHAQGRQALGGLLLRAGELEEAEEHLRLAVQLDPQNKRAKQVLQQVLEKRGLQADRILP